MSMRCLRVPAGCPAVERKTRTAPIGGDTPIFPREGMKSPSAQLRLPAVLLRQPREGRTSGIEPTLRSADGWYAIDFLGAGSHPGSRLPGREVGRPSVEVWCSQPAGQVRPVGARHQHRETDRLHRFAGASSDDQTKKTEVIQFPSAARPLDFLGHVEVRRTQSVSVYSPNSAASESMSTAAQFSRLGNKVVTGQGGRSGGLCVQVR